MFPTDTRAEPLGETPDEVVLERMALLVVGEHRFAVAIDRIREIIPARPYTSLPGSGSHVCGLINLRGRIVTVVDLGARLKLAPASANPDHSIVIVEHRGRLAGLAVGFWKTPEEYLAAREETVFTPRPELAAEREGWLRGWSRSRSRPSGPRCPRAW